MNPPRRGSWDARRLLRVLLPQRIPFVCLALMAVQAAVFLGEARWGGSTFLVTLIRMGAGHGPDWHGAEAWRLLTAGYLHLGWQHLVGNLVMMLLAGMYLEGLLGPSRLLLLYTLSIVVSNLVAAVVLPEVLVAGSSGGVCGMLGALLALAARPRAPLSPGRRLVYVLVVTGIVASIVHATCACGQTLSNLMHVAGGAVGLLLGMSGVLHWRLPYYAWIADWLSIRVSAWAIACVTLLCLAWALLEERPWELSHPQPLVREWMPGTPVSISLPAGAASRSEILADATGGGSYAHAFFGDVMKEPLSVEVTVEQLEEAVPEEQLQEVTRDLRVTLYEEARAPQEPGMRIWMWPMMDKVDGRPVVYSSKMLGTLFLSERWSMYREDWLITVEVTRVYSGMPEEWEPVMMDVVRSVAVGRVGEGGPL